VSIDPTDLSTADENALNFQNCGADAAGHVIPVARSTAPPESSKDSAGVKPEVPEPVKLKSEAAARIFDGKAGLEDADDRCKPVELNPTFDQVKVDMPDEITEASERDVKVGNLGSGSAARRPVVAPVNKVQTGGLATRTDFLARVTRIRHQRESPRARPLCRATLATQRHGRRQRNSRAQ